VRSLRPNRLTVALVLTAAWLTGCGGYADSSAAFRQSLTSGQPEDALFAVNQALEVDTAEQLPKETSGDTALLLLERGTILQALRRYKLSSRDFQAADKDLDVIDVTSDTAGNISKYMFSDDGALYRPPPHEKLLLNTINMINYLARGDAGGAKVEARRFLINKKYLEREEGDARSMLAMGSFLSGFAFEAAGEPGPAMRHYADAQAAGGVAGLKAAVQRLHVRTGADDSRLKTLFEGEQPTVDAEYAELVVVVQTGMAPYRYPERIPIGAAVVSASQPRHGRRRGHRLDADQRRRANIFAAKGVLKWVNFPSLRKVHTNHGRLTVHAGDAQLPTGSGLNVERAVLSEFELIKGTLLASAITRLITRAVAGEISQAAVKSGSNNGLAGLLVGLAVEGAMAAADTPDTRSWVTLPSQFSLARARLPAGTHQIVVRHGDQEQHAEVTLTPGGWGLVNFSGWR
jgi:hypothetical protein